MLHRYLLASTLFFAALDLTACGPEEEGDLDTSSDAVSVSLDLVPVVPAGATGGDFCKIGVIPRLGGSPRYTQQIAVRNFGNITAPQSVASLTYAGESARTVSVPTIPAGQTVTVAVVVTDIVNAGSGGGAWDFEIKVDSTNVIREGILGTYFSGEFNNTANGSCNFGIR